eukprot:scaffold76778_cov63-Cyclotella_meneghiniana.AAC.1
MADADEGVVRYAGGWRPPIGVTTRSPEARVAESVGDGGSSNQVEFTTKRVGYAELSPAAVYLVCSFGL